MVNYDELIALAKSCGFTESVSLDVSTLEFLPEVRDMCASGKCQKFGNSWSCPPAAPPLEDMRDTVKSYSKGIIVQTVGRLEDSYDFEAMMETSKNQIENFRKLWDALEPLYHRLYPMSTGGCSKCKKCTFPDEPCRFPKRMAYSMEACGLFVSKVCVDNGAKYNYGSNTIAYTGCFLLE